MSNKKKAARTQKPSFRYQLPNDRDNNLAGQFIGIAKSLGLSTAALSCMVITQYIKQQKP